MAKHASFGIASRPTSVDQAAALSRLLLIHLGIDNIFLNGLTDLQEILPEEETRARDSLRKRSLTPDHESLDPIELVEIDCEAL